MKPTPGDSDTFRFIALDRRRAHALHAGLRRRRWREECALPPTLGELEVTVEEGGDGDGREKNGALRSRLGVCSCIGHDGRSKTGAVMSLIWHCRVPFLSLCVALALPPSACWGDPPAFEVIDTIPGFDFQVDARGVSADGNVVVGTVSAAIPFQGFRWTHSGQTVGLGFLPGGTHSVAYAASYDGSWIVGYAEYSAVRWGPDGTIEHLRGTGYSSGATAVSAYGNVVAGYYYGCPAGTFRWRSGGGIENVTSCSPGLAGISEDGSVVVGRCGDASPYAFRWTSTVGAQNIGWLGGGNYSSAVAVSSDGAVVVGTLWDGYHHLAFRWTTGGTTSLGCAPPSCYRSDALAVSADGTIVVGVGESYSGQERAFIWSQSLDMQDLQTMLGDTVPAGWVLTRATGISADGLTIVGDGINSHNHFHGAWLARLPRPACWGDLNCDGVFDALDVPAFVLALTDTIAYAQAYPACGFARADINHDGLRDALDVQGFVDALLAGHCPG